MKPETFVTIGLFLGLVTAFIGEICKGANASELIEVDYAGGRYTLEQNGLPVGNAYYNLDTTAKEDAVNIVLRTREAVVIKQPDITVTAKFTVIVSVPAPVTTDVQLTWDIPTKREDGSDLDPVDIIGYSIRGVETYAIVVDKELSYLVKGLTAGTYEFRIATITKEATGEYSVPLIQEIF